MTKQDLKDAVKYLNLLFVYKVVEQQDQKRLLKVITSLTAEILRLGSDCR